MKKMYIAVSDSEWGLHRIWPVFRPFFKRRYPINLHSQQPILEFVLLADCCEKLGAQVVPDSQVEELLKQGELVLKFGKTNLADDIALLSRVSNRGSEWNIKNLEQVGDFNSVLNLERKTWNIFLGISDHLELLEDLFCAQGRLFVKTRSKGFAQIYNSFSEFMEWVGDIGSLAEESRDLIISEVMDIAQINAMVSEGSITRSDEWRHYVYQQRLICSTHAFDCNSSHTEDSGRLVNEKKALAIVEELKESDFPTSYVLDTCTLVDGKIAVVEINNIFSSGIFDKSAIVSLAEAVVTA